MKFRAKPREVTVGILKMGTAGVHYAPGVPAQIAVIDLATRRADVVPLDDFIERFEPVDEDAVKARPRLPNPFDPPPIPEDDFDGYEIRDEESGSRLHMKPIRKPKPKGERH